MCFFSAPIDLGTGTPWFAAAQFGTSVINVPAGISVTVILISPTLVWESASDSDDVTIWYMGGTVPPQGGVEGDVEVGWNWLNNTPISPANTAGWQVVAAADFDGNGWPDLIWQNSTTRQVTVWYYGGAGGAVYQGWNYLNSAESLGWSVVGAADMNGDGVPDLIWQNDTTKQITVDYYGGTGGAVYQGWNYLNAAGAPGWSVVGVADMNGDGVPDLIWQNLSTQQVTVNYYNAAQTPQIIGWNYLNGGEPGWTVVGASDLDGNGEPDLIWQNSATGQVTVNYYNLVGGVAGTAAYSGTWAWIDSNGSPGWSLVVPQNSLTP